MIKELTGSNSTVKFLPATEDDPKQRRPDITTARERIGWSPKVPVKVGLAKAIEYFSQVCSLSFLFVCFRRACLKNYFVHRN